MGSEILPILCPKDLEIPVHLVEPGPNWTKLGKHEKVHSLWLQVSILPFSRSTFHFHSFQKPLETQGKRIRV